MDIILLKKEVEEMFIRRISCWFVVIFLLISFLSGRVRTASAETIELYDNSVILTPFVGREYIIDVFLHEGDRIVFGFSVEQGSFWVRKVDMFITDKVNFERRRDLREWTSLVSKREVTKGYGDFIAPQLGKYYFIFYNPSLLNEKVTIKMTLVKDEEKPTFSIQTSDTRSKSVPLSEYRLEGVTLEGHSYYYIPYTLDDESEIEIYFEADHPIDFLIMTKYDFDKREEKGFIAWGKYRDVPLFHNIFIAPTRDVYYFVFSNRSPETVKVDYELTPRE